MRRRTRIHYTDSQKSQMWDRWQRGESLQKIARLFDRHHSAVRGILLVSGGIRPPVRHRSPRSLTLAEREVISRGLVIGYSIRAMALSLRRAPSTISREIARNGGSETYRASQADESTWARARRPKLCKLVMHRALARWVAEKLQHHWAPQQIAGWLGGFYLHCRRLLAASSESLRSLTSSDGG